MGRIYKAVDLAILILCLPFYLVVTPLIWVYQWCLQRRRVWVGLVVSHWPAHDVREELLVADVSRVAEGLVGVRRRTWHRWMTRSPEYSEEIDYIPIARFWVPTPILGGRRGSLPDTIAPEADDA